ncbi:helix-turn-helix transcriptional regulator [Pseudomonas sp. N40(2020)]|uniref:TetR/AcrR family transcriptional regulator n=1 Tax=Pseudomonas sp. N40(2020) TaxID=2767798 RepID=UPI001656B2BB|nr:TetR/AcrR family transcriptional regulator [Pseudomonas sp. N40(2020)]MBC8996330.1 helix-turn-helix transcriptional regulator [Pseudomonas sp. N40(2020)]
MSTSDTITESALKLFYCQGFHATGVEQLSQVAGVTKKTLYRHFPSKEHLVEAALKLRDAEFMAKIREVVEAVSDPQRPLAYIDFIAAWVQEPDFHGCAFINASAEYSVQTDQPHILAKLHKQQLLTYLEEICTHAKLKQPSSAARQLFLIGEGLIVTCQVNGSSKDVIDAAREMTLMLTARQFEK